MGLNLDPAKKIIKKVRNTISRYKMIRHGDRVIVAVSGGPDSVCLIKILHEIKDDLEIELLLAHFDHGLRPDRDEDETMFVMSLARSLSLPFETKKAYKTIGIGKGSLEEKARQARYRFLKEIKEVYSAQKIAVGHNLNDQAETVLMRLLRGSGASGLTGIPPCRDGDIIRPLIQVTRTEIESYLELTGLTYVTDYSNFEARYLRNRIRLELLPQLRKYQPQIVKILAQTADILRRDDECLEAEAEKWIEGAIKTSKNGEIHIPLPSFIKLPVGLEGRVIRHALKMTGSSNLRRISLRHVEDIRRMAMGKKPQAQVNLPNNLHAKRVYDKLVFSMGKDMGSKGFSYLLEGPGTFYLEALGSRVCLEEMKRGDLTEMDSSPRIVFLDAEHIDYPLEIRNFKPGDRFVPLGMIGHRKLKDFFIDLKVPSGTRRQIPILICRNKPVWICGLRIDDRFKVTPDTKKVLKVTLKVSAQ